MVTVAVTAAPQPARLADGALAQAVDAERRVVSECATPASIAVVSAPGSEPAGAGMFVAALQDTRLRSGPVSIVERDGLNALTAEACRSGARQRLIFAKFITMVGMSSSGSSLTLSVHVAKTSTGEVVLASQTTVSSLAEASAFFESTARQANAAITSGNYQCRDTFDLVATGTASYACRRSATTTAAMSETIAGEWPIGLTVTNVDPLTRGTRTLSGVVSLEAGRASASGRIETGIGVGGRPCTGMRSIFDDAILWPQRAQVPATVVVTVPGSTPGAWSVKVTLANTAQLFALAKATVSTRVTAGAAPGDCPSVTNAVTQAFTPLRGFDLPALTMDPVCQPTVVADLAAVPGLSHSLQSLETGKNLADCTTKVVRLTASLVRRFSGS